MFKKYIYIISLISVFLATCCCKQNPENNQSQEPGVPIEATNTYLMGSLSDIESYASAQPSNRMSVTMLRNETEHLQLVIKTASNESLDIVREGNPDQLSFECRSLRTFEKMQDVLVPCNGKVKPSKNIVKVWLSFKTSAQAAPGTYREIIRFKNDRAEYAVSVSIKVVDAEIPAVSSLPSVFGINPDNFIFTGLTEDQKIAKRKEVSDLLLSYRISPYFSSWLAGTMKTECFSSPYSWNDYRTWDYLKDERFGRIAFPFHGLSDEQLSSMLEKIKAEGLMDKAYFYIWDEPTLPSEYQQIHQMAERLHKYAPEAKVITSFYCGPKEGEYKDDLFAVFDLLNGATSIFCTGVWSLQGNETRSEMCKAKLRQGQEWWSYVCMSDYPGLAQNSTGIPNRVVMWRHWKEQTSGFLYWVVNSFGSMSPLRSRSGLPEGDGVLVYPGEPFGVEVPCVSIRLERWRDGAEEYELLQMYSQKNGRSAAEAMLSNVYTNPKQFTSDIKHVNAFRKKLIDGITN